MEINEVPDSGDSEDARRVLERAGRRAECADVPVVDVLDEERARRDEQLRRAVTP